jgi:8-oxo-dGTP diphosphatase
VTPTGSALIEAAGGVVWRPAGSGGVEVAIVHRPRHDDWSLPKGKLEPGELPITAAVREILEETGMRVIPGRRLRDLRYTLPAGSKRVRYWSMRVIGGGFAANEEVDTLRWVAPAMARAILGPGQGGVVADFAAGHRETRATVVVVGDGFDDVARLYGDTTYRDVESAADVITAQEPEAVRVAPAAWPAVAEGLGIPDAVPAEGVWVMHRSADDGGVVAVERLPAVGDAW